MSNLSSVPRLTIQQINTVTPVITAAAYSAGDQVGDIMTLSSVVRQDTNTQLGTAMLTSVSIIDKAKQSAAMTLWFFKTSPTLASTDHAAFNLTDANLAASFIGTVSVGASYASSTSNSVSSTSNLNLAVFNSSGGKDIYCVAQTTGTPTYVSTSDLIFQFTFLVD